MTTVPSVFNAIANSCPIDTDWTLLSPAGNTLSLFLSYAAPHVVTKPPDTAAAVEAPTSKEVTFLPSSDPGIVSKSFWPAVESMLSRRPDSVRPMAD